MSSVGIFGTMLNSLFSEVTSSNAEFWLYEKPKVTSASIFLTTGKVISVCTSFSVLAMRVKVFSSPSPTKVSAICKTFPLSSRAELST